MVVHTQVMLVDDGLGMRRRRHARLLRWARLLVDDIVENAVAAATDPLAAAEQEQVAELRQELSEAGLLDTLPMSFGKPQSAPEERWKNDPRDTLMAPSRKSRRRGGKKKHRRQNQSEPSSAEPSVSMPTNVVDLGNPCMVFYEGDYLWYPATVAALHGEYITVQFDGATEFCTVPSTWVQPTPTPAEAADASIGGGKAVSEQRESAVLSSSSGDGVAEDTGAAVQHVASEALEESTHSPAIIRDSVASTPQDDMEKKGGWSGPDARNPYADVSDKYWAQRFRLFSLFDKGIRLDAESWYSVTPEEIAGHIAERCACSSVIDPFCGVGGNCIQLAFTCDHVIAIDIDPNKIEAAKHNARIYGVDDRIEFLVGDALQLLPRLKADVVLLAPPWGGPEYLENEAFHLKTIQIGQANGEDLYHTACSVTPSIAYFLPRNVQLDELESLAPPHKCCEVEDQFLNGKLKTRVAYFGSLVALEHADEAKERG